MHCSPRIPQLFALFALLVATFVADPTAAATFAVTKTVDTNDGACDGDCSLREAVIAANTASGSDTVLIPAGTFTLTIRDAVIGVDEGAAATGDLDILGGGLVIEGTGASGTVIDASGLDSRIFHVERNFSSAPIALRNLTLTGGNAGVFPAGSKQRNGSALWVADRFTGLVVTLEGVVASGNLGPNAIASVTTLHIDESTISDNRGGAAVRLTTDAASKTGASATRITNTVIEGNDGLALNAVKEEAQSHQFVLENATLSGNNRFPTVQAAAIFTTNSGQLNHVTISDDGGSGLTLIDDFFAGIPVVEVQNSIFASNVAGSVTTVGDGIVLPVSRGGNVLDDAGGGVFTGTGDQINSNPAVAPLADNGGPTLSHDLLPESTAIDAALASGPLGPCPDRDQRGELRPLDGDGDGLAACDAGAVEFVPEPRALVLATVAFAALLARAWRRQR